MVVVWIHRCSTVVLTLGLVLVAVGAIYFVFGETHSVAAASRAGTLSASRTNPDEILRDEALEIRRRVAEYRERSRAEPASIRIWKVYLLSGLALSLVGAVGRFTTDRSTRPEATT
ncbi:MAG: hypothetical protein SGI72_09455 [Planctomycetota bacterium]|nr:hypothetical protein [Planctomycetota bacterium]